MSTPKVKTQDDLAESAMVVIENQMDIMSK